MRTWIGSYPRYPVHPWTFGAGVFSQQPPWGPDGSEPIAVFGPTVGQPSPAQRPAGQTTGLIVAALPAVGALALAVLASLGRT